MKDLMRCGIILLIFCFAQFSLAMPNKIDSEGKFTPFPGVTIISDIGEKNKPFWSQVYDSLNENSLITEYFSLLPLSSYHMTTINLFTQDDFPSSEAWRTWVDHNKSWFKAAHSFIAANKFQPEITYKGTMVFGVIMVIVQLKKEQAEKISEIAGSLGVTYGLPHEFHVTVGYAYKSIPPEAFEIISALVTQKFNEIFSSHPESFSFEEPKLTYFNDMTAFIPWSGEVNPF